MIIGIGVDICSVPRMRRSISIDGFVERVFHAEEIEYVRGSTRPEESLAGSFAAKEALAKALGIGLSKLGLKGAWVRRTERGPVLCLDDRISEYVRSMGVGRIFLSISHEREVAVAFVVLEGGS
ncbi:MAG: holo-ACP synthase [Thermanaerothrix sp.]|nr:holo-ACP synthase [Thermanaerothrix sp.]